MPDRSDPKRTEKGLALAASPGMIKQVREDVYAVKSQSGVGVYQVDLLGKLGRCSCPDYVKRELPCKHLIGVRFYLEKQSTGSVRQTVSERVPTSYHQAWEAYDRAQTEEVRLFDLLLADLVASIKEPPQTTGRPRIPLSDGVFCAVQKVYSQLSCRRARSLFGFAEERGQISRTPGYIVSSRILNRPDVTSILHDLIARSALPLAALENGFAPDSTGIRSTSFGAWIGEEHREVRQHRWLKAHALAGVKTHVIVKAIVTDKTGADYPRFEPLVRGTLKGGFSIKEIYADKAYTGRSNYALADELGFAFYAPFRLNDSPKPTVHSGRTTRDDDGRPTTSRLWTKAFHFFQLRREEFDRKYHQRSNVEAVFSALKRKFGETLRSRTETAQVNELLAKILAYNITVLIHEIFEHGVLPDFLREVECFKTTASVSKLDSAS